MEKRGMRPFFRREPSYMTDEGHEVYRAKLIAAGIVTPEEVRAYRPGERPYLEGAYLERLKQRYYKAGAIVPRGARR